MAVEDLARQDVGNDFHGLPWTHMRELILLEIGIDPQPVCRDHAQQIHTAGSVGADPALHCADTLAAGDGLCDPQIARRVTAAAPAAVEVLRRHGVRFDFDATGALHLGLEAAHSRRRIVHAAGDGTGREIMRALTETVRATPSITVLEGIEARRLLVADRAVTGVLAASRSGAVLLPTGRVVIATGGVGGLFLHTTNPLGSFGQGLALAARAGAMLADLEFVQFHPTALDAGPVASAHPLPLVSEAVRGEGARLIDETGVRFMETEPGQELSPRDVVGPASDPAIVALMITIAALTREESRGAHFRTDFPRSHAAPRRATLGLHAALRAAREVMSFTAEARSA